MWNTLLLAIIGRGGRFPVFKGASRTKNVDALRSSPIGAMAARAAMTAIILGQLIACSDSAVPEYGINDIPGEYEGSYYGGHEVFIIRNDGTFTQKFVAGGTVAYENSGTWEVTDDDRLRFYPMFRAPAKSQPLAISSGSFKEEPGVIYFDPDASYYIRKKR